MTAAWRQRLGPASFRGVEFFVARGEREGGRRVVEQAVPGSEAAPHHDDQGLEGRGFQVEGFVLGSNYFEARDALLTELERPGPGELVHPYYGARRVVAASYRVAESGDEGGVARFTIEFRETSARVNPTAVVDARSKVSSAVDGLKTSTRAAHLAAFDDAVKLRDAVTLQLSFARARLASITTLASLPGEAAAGLRTQLSALNPVTLARSGASAFDSFAGVFVGLRDALESAAPANAYTLALGAYSQDLGPAPSGTSAQRVAARRNYDSTRRMWRRLCIGLASEVLSFQRFDSYDAAEAAREELTELIDAHVFFEEPDDAYQSLTLLRASLVETVPGESSALPRVQRYTPTATTNSLVLAHRLYGDLTRESDIVARNRLPNPAQIRADEELEVLSS